MALLKQKPVRRCRLSLQAGVPFLLVFFIFYSFYLCYYFTQIDDLLSKGYKKRVIFYSEGRTESFRNNPSLTHHRSQNHGKKSADIRMSPSERNMEKLLFFSSLIFLEELLYSVFINKVMVKSSSMKNNCHMLIINQRFTNYLWIKHPLK